VRLSFPKIFRKHKDAANAIDGIHWMIDEAMLNIIRIEAESASTIQKFDNQQNYQTRLVDDNGIAWLHVDGVITDKINWWCGDTYTNVLREQLQESLNDPQTKAIVLSIDSPGGTAYGIHELATEIFEARSQKPIFSYITGMAASAAMYLASAAKSVHIESPASTVGNLGVVVTHVDISRALDEAGITITEITSGKDKRLVSNYKPLSIEAKAELQKRTDHFYSLMCSDIARFRGVSEKEAHEKFMDGKTFNGSEAVSIGLADAIHSKSDFSDLVLRSILQTQNAKPSCGYDSASAPEGGRMSALELGQSLINNIKAVVRSSPGDKSASDVDTTVGYAEGYSQGLEQGKKEGALTAINSNAQAIIEAKALERQRVKQILSLADGYPRYKDKILEAAYEGDKSASDVAWDITVWDREKTEQAKQEVLNITVAPVPGTGGAIAGEPLAGGAALLDAKAIHERAKALCKENPALTIREAIIQLNEGKE